MLMLCVRVRSTHERGLCVRTPTKSHHAGPSRNGWACTSGGGMSEVSVYHVACHRGGAHHNGTDAQTNDHEDLRSLHFVLLLLQQAPRPTPD